MPGPTTSVLIVDDNPGVRHALRALLRQRAGLHVCAEAVDGTDAVSKASEHKPDLVLMDVLMPNLNGLEAAAVIRKLVPTTRIVVFTMYGDVIGQSLANATGINLVLSKTGDTHALIQELQQVLLRDSSRLGSNPQA